VKIFERVEPWRLKIEGWLARLLDFLAAFWFAHWLLISGSILVAAAAGLKWVDFAYSHHPFGVQLTLLQEVSFVPHLSLLSYGMLGVVALVGGLIRFFLPSPRPFLLPFGSRCPCGSLFNSLNCSFVSSPRPNRFPSSGVSPRPIFLLTTDRPKSFRSTLIWTACGIVSLRRPLFLTWVGISLDSVPAFSRLAASAVCLAKRG
jgi:hypothetical protein